jgi:hypothetical protein
MMRPDAQVMIWPRRRVVAHGRSAATTPWAPPLRAITPTIPPRKRLKTTIIMWSRSVSGPTMNSSRLSMVAPTGL